MLGFLETSQAQSSTYEAL